MAKKSFKDNPALQFISSTEPELADSEGIQPEKNPQEKSEVKPQPRPIEKPPKGYKLNPIYIETKSRRLQLVLQPSLYDRVKAKATAAGLSVNEYIHQVLDNATRETEE